jgi:basic membrane protein A and related proteins
MIKRKRLLAVALVAVLGLAAAACGDDDDDSAGGTGSSAPSGAAETTVAEPGTTVAEPGTTVAEPGTTAAEPGTTAATPGSTTPSGGSAPAGNEDLGEPLTPGGEVEKIGLVFDAIGRGDGSFNDSAARGYDTAKEQLGVEGNEQVPAADGSDRADKLSLLCDDGYNPVIAVGFLFAEPLAAVAKECPDTSFGIVDATVEGADNVSGLVFAEHQGSFLVGAAAALKSETGHIGFIGGLQGSGLIERFQAGYEAGAKAVNPDITVDVKYLGTTVDAFNDPSAAKTSTEAMIEGGADVIYSAAGQSGLGMFEAVKEANDAGETVWAIGVDSDQGSEANAGVPNDVKPYILTSMIKRVDVAVFETIRDVNDGTFSAGPRVFDLAANGVGYSTTGGHVDDIVDQLEDFKQQIIDGDIEVPDTPES